MSWWRSHVLASRARAFWLAALACAVVVMCGWAIASPPGSSPDEEFHLPSIWCAQGLEAGVCEAGGGPDSYRLPAAIASAPCHAHQPEQSAACIWSDAVASGQLTDVNTSGINAVTGAYPNSYYVVASLFASPNVSRSVILIRLFNAGLCLALFFAILALVGARLRRALAVSWLVGVVPLGLFIIPSVNPSSWAITGAGMAWAAALGCFEARIRTRQVVLGAITVVCVALAAAARSDAAVMAVIGVLAAVLVSPSARAFVRRRWRFVVVGGVAAVAAFVLLLSATGQWALLTRPFTDLGAGNFTLFLGNIQQVPYLWEGSFGSWGLGQLDVGLPALVRVPMVLVIGGLVFWGVRSVSRWRGLALLVLVGALVVTPVAFLQAQGASVGTWVQPRYLLPLILTFLGLAILTPEGRGWLDATQSWIVGAAVSVAALISLEHLIRRYVTGVDVYSWNLDSDIEWWWDPAPSPNLVLVLTSLAFAGLAGLTLRYFAVGGDDAPARRQ